MKFEGAIVGNSETENINNAGNIDIDNCIYYDDFDYSTSYPELILNRYIEMKRTKEGISVNYNPLLMDMKFTNNIKYNPCRRKIPRLLKNGYIVRITNFR